MGVQDTLRDSNCLLLPQKPCIQEGLKQRAPIYCSSSSGRGLTHQLGKTIQVHIAAAQDDADAA